ncbi:hypothetical protein TSUD_144180 [Trifolium subterraneum]|uniref:Cell wall hydroxyproline-rich glycoprotein n=1 Tax=Trifolium subterraneum TaxID=3900 RepID=A0A2Z6NXS4_TRISU|nr:hypothetical protein TSUD_144180 [Trifolium subterraneum]
MKNQNSLILAFLFLILHFTTTKASFGVGVGVGGGVVWIGGGNNNNNQNPKSYESPTSKMDSAYSVLQAWKSSITDDPLKILDSWVGSNVCSYKGIFCANPENGIASTTASASVVVVAIDLNHANLQGTFVKELSLLTDMTLLHLNSNRFSGTVPETFKDLVSLQELDLSSNQLSASFGFMGSKIKEILFLNNQLTGCIPEGVGLFTEMEVLDVSFNSLMGHLPDTLSCLQNIEVLNLAHNQLSGELSDIICSLRSLANLTVAYNFFSGFSQQCSKLNFRNVGFDFSLNCIPGRIMQRPEPECSMIPGGSLSCLRIPTPKPLVCGSMYVSASKNTDSTSQSHSP